MTEAEIMRCFDVTRKTEGSNKGSQLALRGCTTGHPARARLTPSHIGAQTAHVKKKRTHATRDAGPWSHLSVTQLICKGEKTHISTSLYDKMCTCECKCVQYTHGCLRHLQHFHFQGVHLSGDNKERCAGVSPEE